MKNTKNLVSASLTAVAAERDEWQGLISQLANITNKIISRRARGVFYRLVVVPSTASPRGLVWCACRMSGEHVVWADGELLTTLPPQRGVQCHWYARLEELRILIVQQYRTLCSTEKYISQQLQCITTAKAAVATPVPTPLTFDLTAVAQERVRIKQEIIKLLK